MGLFIAVALGWSPAPVHAQPLDIVNRCATGEGSDAAREVCRLAAQAIEISQPRIGLAAAGGNPVPGTASTIGMRLASTPRVSVAARTTGVWVRLPPVRDVSRREGNGFILPSINVDGAVGVFQGFSPVPTVGGVGSIDVLASFGLVAAPGASGISNGSTGTIGAGVRLGILRESFLFPGVSLTGSYRRLGTITVGDPDLDRDDGFYRLSGNSVAGVRATVGKRILSVGATAGVGYDRFRSNVRVGARDPAGEGAESWIRFGVDGVSTTRFTAFANVAWTMMILNLVGELGWQSGGERVPGELPPGVRVEPGRRGLFGSLAARLTI